MTIPNYDNGAVRRRDRLLSEERGAVLLRTAGYAVLRFDIESASGKSKTVRP